MKIDLIAFDADDTLWENEALYQKAQAKLRTILSPWRPPQVIDKVLYETEMSNMPIYGYGIKAFSLSMIETALKVSNGGISGNDITAIIAITHSMLEAEIQLHPHVEATLASLSLDYPLMIITKGDLLDQTQKINRSGLAKFFRMTEIINDKTPEAYQAILEKHNLVPEHFLMIGNSLRSDILPVLALGGSAVHIPANTTWAHETVNEFDPRIDRFYELEHMGQLLDLISKNFMG